MLCGVKKEVKLPAHPIGIGRVEPHGNDLSFHGEQDEFFAALAAVL
jgi:hypothetical protein